MPPATPNLPTPDFTFDPDAPGACIAGVRPFRNESYRLDPQPISDKFFVHNYGHGGAGITLSWGCAAKVHDMVRAHLATVHETKAAVLGAGVMGLTAATRLLELGLQVKIYSDRTPAQTTSAKAGGQWAVSVIEYKGKKAELADILRIAYKTFKDSIDQEFGVYERPNYTATESENLDAVEKLVPGLLPPREFLPRLPFAGPATSGFLYKTLLVEPPVFLARLEKDLRGRGVTFAQLHKFTSKAEILASVPEKIVVNCTGLGAGKLFSDPKMAPIQGQLAMLPAQPALQYLFGRSGYMFPRSDHVVIGGTFDRVDSEVPDRVTCKKLVAHIASVFGQGRMLPLPDNHIHHPDHAPIVDPAIPMS